MKRHSTLVENVKDEQGTWFVQARCSCGWHDQLRLTPTEARNDAMDHERVSRGDAP